jgi:high-affinity K+ transport system ATPase subunit B
MLEKKSLWNTEIMAQALLDSVRKLDPRWMVKNPVMSRSAACSPRRC